MSNALPRVSVVIPAFNAEKTIGPLLDSLLKLDYPDYEVIVVDDGSRDQTKAIAEQYPVTIISQPNRGASAARDSGLRASTGEVVAYVDSDVAVAPDWLRNLVGPLSDPSVAATTGKTVFRRNETCTSWMRSVDIESRNAHRMEYTRLANGPNSAFRKSNLIQAGGFNPSWYHAEDTEVSYRLWKAGYRIRYVPEAIVYHVPEDNWRVFLRKRYRDAYAFTRILLRYPRVAATQDDFVTLSMKIQPALFLILISLFAVTVLTLGGPLFFPLAMASLLAEALALTFSLATAVRIARSSRKLSFLIKSAALAQAQGFVWGIGLAVGVASNLVRRGTTKDRTHTA